MTAGSRYVKVVFDARELNVMRIACDFVSEKEYDTLGDMTPAELEKAARQAKKATDSDIAGRIVALFKPGQEILIEREDLEPVQECLRAYEDSVPEEQARELNSLIVKIGRYL